MTVEQAQQRLEEISRLLMQREKAEKVVKDIDTQIAILAGASKKQRAPKSQQLSRDDFVAIAAGGAQ